MSTRRPGNFSNVWFVTREYGNLAGAGGIKDVCKQLAEALARTGCRVRVVLPLYGFMDPAALGFSLSDIAFEVDMPYVGYTRREVVRIYSNVKNEKFGGAKRGKQPPVAIYLLDAERFSEKKSVYTYSAEEEAVNPYHRRGSGHYDYFAMNVLLQKAALALMVHLQEKPDVIHCHDGHTAILPAMIREIDGFRHYFAGTGAVVTVHNAGIGYHQEVDDLPFAQTITGLPPQVITDNLLDERFDPLLAASTYAVMNTVSENYARELRETDDDALTGWLGHLLLSRGVRLEGVTNGIDPGDFDPTRPEVLGLPAGFDPLQSDLAGKRKCREHLVTKLQENRAGRRNSLLSRVVQDGYLDSEFTWPLFTLVGRLTAQKGVDKLLGAMENLFAMDSRFQVLMLGSGSSGIEEALARIAGGAAYQGKVCILRGYDTALANLVYAAGDFFLVPSQYEPCGLTDFMAQLLANLPIVHHVGGLVKVLDGVTGLSYAEHNAAALMGTMQRALRLFRDSPEEIRKMQRQAVKHIHDNFTWDRVVLKYFALYEEAFRMVR